MPIRPFSIPLDTPGRTELVPPGDKINSVSVTGLGASQQGVFRFEFGLGQSTSPLRWYGVLRFPDVLDNPDARQGVYLVNDTAQVGDVVEGFVSYQRASDPPSAGIEYQTAS